MLVNGKPTGLISAADRALQYGDGLFETIAVIDGKPALWSEHMHRLERGEQRLELPLQDKERLLQEVHSLIPDDCHAAVIKIVVTRGTGGRGYRPPREPVTNRIISLHAWPDYPPDWFDLGVCLRICRTPISCNPYLAGIKHLNRLEQVLARQEWDDEGIAEGLMLNAEGQVIEGTHSNLFLLKNGVLLTPDLSHCGVEGVVRNIVLRVAENLAIHTDITQLGVSDVKSAEALFITNSVMGLCPVARLDEHRFDREKIPPELMEWVNRIARGQLSA